jgi:hypothetical protein
MELVFTLIGAVVAVLVVPPSLARTVQHAARRGATGLVKKIRDTKGTH